MKSLSMALLGVLVPLAALAVSGGAALGKERQTGLARVVADQNEYDASYDSPMGPGPGGPGGCSQCGGCGCDQCGGCNDCGCDEPCGCDDCGCACDPCCGSGLFDHCGHGILDRLFCCGPFVRVRAEALALRRNASDEVDILGLFNTSEFGLDWAWGLRTAAEVRLQCDRSLELTYFGLHEWQGNFGSTDFVNQITVDASYSSEIHHAELNYWVPVTCVGGISGSMTVGGRYVSLREDFALAAASLVSSGAVSQATTTDNNLIGAHVGFLLNGCRGPLSVRWDGKVGVAANIAEQRTRFVAIDDTATVVVNVAEKVDDTDIAYVADTSVTVSYQVGCHASIYAGFNLLWIDGLALAPNQLDFEDPVNFRTGRINNDSHVLYHGISTGVEFTW